VKSFFHLSTTFLAVLSILKIIFLLIFSTPEAQGKAPPSTKTFLGSSIFILGKIIFCICASVTLPLLPSTTDINLLVSWCTVGIVEVLVSYEYRKGALFFFQFSSGLTHLDSSIVNGWISCGMIFEAKQHDWSKIHVVEPHTLTVWPPSLDNNLTCLATQHNTTVQVVLEYSYLYPLR